MIRTLREARGMSQNELSQKIGWKQPMLSRLEKGLRQKFSLEDINLICSSLEIKTDDLFITPFFKSSNITLYHGDALNILSSIENESVDCVLTSPPYYGQRDYGENQQIGLEDHPSEYIFNLINIFNEVRRILKPTGSLWVNIGDTYWSGKGQSQGIDKKQKNRRFTRPQDRTGEPPLCVPKQRLLIPHRFAIAMQEQGWIVRNDNVWYKQNPIPDPVNDRCAIAHEYVFHFVKQRKYYFNAEAVAIPSNGERDTKPPLSVWEIKTSSSKKDHIAVFPEELAHIPIRATCPLDGIFLDPFCGSGTALYFSLKESGQRKVIGIDISKKYLDECKALLASLIETTNQIPTH